MIEIYLIMTISAEDFVTKRSNPIVLLVHKRWLLFAIKSASRFTFFFVILHNRIFVTHGISRLAFHCDSSLNKPMCHKWVILFSIIHPGQDSFIAKASSDAVEISFF